MRRQKTIIMTEFSDARYDARVIKEATSLSNAGYRVHLFMFRADCLKKTEHEENGIHYKIYPFKRKYEDGTIFSKIVKYLNAAMLIFRMNLSILFEKGDIYHSHNLIFALSCLFASKIYKSKLVYDAHELWLSDHWVDYAAQRLEKVILNKADFSIECSETRAKLVSKFYHIHRPLTILNCPKYINGKSVRNRNLLRTQLNLSIDNKIMLFTGNYLVNTRLQDKIIECLPLMVRQIVFVLIGYGNQTETDFLLRIARECNVVDRIFFLQSVKHDQLFSLAGGADMSICLLENTGLGMCYPALNKFYEAIMFGLPVVASDLPGLRQDTLDNGVGPVGIVCNPLDVPSMAREIEAVIFDNAKIDMFKKNAFELAATRWNWENQEKKLIERYRKLFASDCLS